MTMPSKNPSTAIVIGAGIAGCATAYALAQKNIAVTLIEREHAVATLASGNPLAVLYPRLTGQPTVLEALNLEGYLHSLGLIAHLGAEVCQYHAFGVIQLAMNVQLAKQQANAFTRYANHATFNMTQHQPQALSDMAGVTLTHAGLFFKDAGAISLAHLCGVLIDSPHIQLKTHCDALTIARGQANTWHVKTLKDPTQATSPNEQLEADMVVIANSHDALKLSQTAHLPLIVARGQLSHVPSTQQSTQLKRIVCGDGYITPVVEDTHYLGATFQINDPDASVRMVDHQRNFALLNNLSPALFNALATSPVKGRVAWRCQTMDYLPAAGPLLDAKALQSQTIYHNHSVTDLPWLHGLYVNVGHGAKGFLTAPMCGAIIANHATHTPQNISKPLLNALQPNRFIMRSLGLKALAQHLLDETP